MKPSAADFQTLVLFSSHFLGCQVFGVPPSGAKVLNSPFAHTRLARPSALWDTADMGRFLVRQLLMPTPAPQLVTLVSKALSLSPLSSLLSPLLSLPPPPLSHPCISTPVFALSDKIGSDNLQDYESSTMLKSQKKNHSTCACEVTLNRGHAPKNVIILLYCSSEEKQ